MTALMCWSILCGLGYVAAESPPGVLQGLGWVTLFYGLLGFFSCLAVLTLT